MQEELSAVMSRFATVGLFTHAERIDTGHINQTFRVVTGGEQGRGEYLLQRINTTIFPDPAGLMANIATVTQHIAEQLGRQNVADLERRVLRIVPTREGELYATDAAAGCWRLYIFIGETHPLDDRPSLAEIYQAGLGFGTFLAQLIDLPAATISESIPYFHNGSRRLAAFIAALSQDVAERVEDVGPEIEFILRHQKILTQPETLLDSGELPLRITHNDTKSNNILLDNHTGEALAVVDLDLVMPGLTLYDLGDLVRTSSTGVAEDEPNIERIVVQEDHLRAAVEGFLAGAGPLLTDRERESLPLGPPYMALIMATRFLTDYLSGDIYYRIHHPEHNLQRARAQIALTEQLLKKRSLLDQIVAAS